MRRGDCYGYLTDAVKCFSLSVSLLMQLTEVVGAEGFRYAHLSAKDK